MRFLWSREHKEFSRKQLILAIEKNNAELASLRHAIGQLSKDLMRLNDGRYMSCM